VLLRLVFILYAEDRGVTSSATDVEARRLYDQGYGVRALHAKLTPPTPRAAGHFSRRWPSASFLTYPARLLCYSRLPRCR
jgi:hypothetical protein